MRQDLALKSTTVENCVSLMWRQFLYIRGIFHSFTAAQHNKPEIVRPGFYRSHKPLLVLRVFEAKIIGLNDNGRDGNAVTGFSLRVRIA